MNFPGVLENTIYFLALINPPSKIFLLCSKQPPFTRRELFSISMRSTIAALAILVTLASAGSFILVTIFHVEIYSLSVAGGIIIFLVGLKAVTQGKFFYDEDTTSLKTPDISIVPLAAPLIAGPGVITAAISASSIFGLTSTLLSLTIALVINFILMLLSSHIGRAMERVNATGPMIRITGLIVTAVAVQMIFSGCGEWLKHTLSIVTK